jgi:hypothetical protein
MGFWYFFSNSGGYIEPQVTLFKRIVVNRPTLKLPASFIYKAIFEYALKQIDLL